MSESNDVVKQKIKKALEKITGDTSKEELVKVKEEFKDAIKDADPSVIAEAEGELVKEGRDIKDLIKACDAHMELFKDAIKNPKLKVPKDHPIYMFRQDHKNILEIMERLSETAEKTAAMENFKDAETILESAKRDVQLLLDAENHNVRQENTLFPVLEKHGIEQPPAIMWYEHNEMKEMKKNLLKLFEKRNEMSYADFAVRFKNFSIALFEKFAAHTQKEEHILYVTALKNINDEEWKDIKEECDNLGYFKPDEKEENDEPERI